MSSWANQDHDIHYSPVSIDTVGTHVGFAETLLLVLREGCVEDHVMVTMLLKRFLLRQGRMRSSNLVLGNRTTFMDEQELAEEADFLDTLPLAGFPKEESERRKAWSKVPRRVRLGIRRLHTMMNHKPKEVLVLLVQVLRGAGAFEELVNAAKIFQCESCRVSDEKTRTHPVSAPPPYEFNHTVSVDVFETADYTGHKYSWLNIVDVGTVATKL